MTQDWETLINEYRVEPPEGKSILDVVPYLLGFFLLIFPFVRPLAVPMALFSLFYFAAVFLFLAISDTAKSLLPSSKRAWKRLTRELVVLINLGKSHMDQVSRSLRYALAFRSARALWEMLFFSSGVASEKVFPNSNE